VAIKTQDSQIVHPELLQPGKLTQLNPPQTVVESEALNHQTAITPMKTDGKGVEQNRRSSRNRLKKLISAVVLLAGMLGFWNSLPEQPLSATTVVSSPRLLTVPIGELEVGQRVIGENADRSQVDETIPDVDEQTWYKLELRMTKTNGGELSLTLLRPSVWFEAHDAQVGSTIPISMPEMGAVGNAEVLSITSCPSITPGEGNVVTGKFIHHSDGNLLNVSLEDSDEQIGVTDNHPYWSEDRRTYIPAGELKVGETVRTEHGLRRIGKILPRPRDEPVYNIEVHREHVYLVGSAGTLVHNSCPEFEGGTYGGLGTEGGTLHRHHMPADSASPLSKSNGPAIQMEPVDHRRTASYGGGTNATNYRARQQELIDQGNFDDAFLMDVEDIQSKFGPKYDQAILDAMDALPH